MDEDSLAAAPPRAPGVRDSRLVREFSNSRYFYNIFVRPLPTVSFAALINSKLSKLLTS